MYKHSLRLLKLVVALVLLNTHLIAQSFQYDWHRNFSSVQTGNSSANGICAQGISHYAIGTFEHNLYFKTFNSEPLFASSNSASTDIIITKQIDTVLWQVILGGNGQDTGMDISTDLIGNLYCVGSFRNTVDFDPSIGVNNATAIGASDIFILKLDTLGNFLWVKTIGGIGNDHPNKVKVNSNGEIIVAGDFESSVNFDPNVSNFNLSSNGATDVFVLSISNSGNFNWVKQIGGIGNDDALSLALKNNQIYTSGFFEDIVDFNPGIALALDTALGNKDGFVLQLDSIGNFVQQFAIQGSNNESITGIAIDSSNNIVIVGNFKDTIDTNPSSGANNLISANKPNSFVAKYTNAGVYLFSFELKALVESYAYDVATIALNKIVVCGRYGGPLDFDPSSNTAFLTTYGGFIAYYSATGIYDWARRVGPYDVIPKTKTVLNALAKGTTDLFVAASIELNYSKIAMYGAGKINSPNNNDPMNVKATASQREIETANYVATDLNSNVYTFGSFTYDTDFDPSTAVDVKQGQVITSAYMHKMDGAGNYLYSKILKGATIQHAITDPQGNSFVLGNYSKSVDFDPNIGSTILNTSGNPTNGYFAKYDNNGNLLFVKNLITSGNFSGVQIRQELGTNNIYIAYRGNNVDADPSATNTNLTNGNVLAKYDSLGNFLWLKNIGTYVAGFKINYNNNVILFGASTATSDYDPGPNTYTIPAPNINSYTYFSKLDSSGQFIFANRFDANNNFILVTNPYQQLDDVCIDSLNNIYISIRGEYFENIAIGAFSNIPLNGGGQYIIKFNNQGQLIWKKQFQESSFLIIDNDKKRSILIDKHWNVFATRLFGGYNSNGGSDFDPSINSTYLISTTAGRYPGYLYLDSTGKTLSGKTLDGSYTFNTTIKSVALSPNNEIYICGEFKDIVDMSMQNGTGIQSSFFEEDCYILKLNACSSSNSTTQNVINCGSFTIKNFPLTTSGNYTFTFPNASGCDSNQTYALTILPPFINYNLSATHCGSFNYLGTNYGTSSLIKDTFSSAFGCDSIINFNLTILPISTNTIAASACNNYTFNGNTYTNSGLYPDTFVNSVGCDSIVTLTLNILSTYTNTVTINACDSYNYKGITYTSSKIFIDTFINSSNCDSSVTTSLIIDTTYNVQINVVGNLISAVNTSATYQWIKCNPFSIIVGATAVNYIPTQLGLYALIQGNGNCSDTSNCISFIPDGLNNLNGFSKIILSPNPTKGILNITYPTTQNASATIKIIDATGRIVKQIEIVFDGTENTMDISELAGGIYVVEIDVDGAKWKEKLVKE